MSLTRRDKLAIVLIRIENTAAYFIAGWLIGKIAPQFFWLFLRLSSSVSPSKLFSSRTSQNISRSQRMLTKTSCSLIS
jgi:hypothetical protein